MVFNGSLLMVFDGSNYTFLRLAGVPSRTSTRVHMFTEQILFEISYAPLCPPYFQRTTVSSFSPALRPH